MLDLKNARILITNDDGIHAQGIGVLERIARTISDDVWVIAPETEQSATGHSLTLRRPLRLHKYSQQRFSVDGTPTDSVLIGVNEVLKAKKPDLILSGVNKGGNLGEDITYSGTVAAAMEGTLLGIPSFAFSQFYTDPNNVIWDCAEQLAFKVIQTVCSKPWKENTLINVNFPAQKPEYVKGVKVAAQGRRKIGDDLCKVQDPRGDDYFWIGALRSESQFNEGTDIHAVMNDYISVTPVSLDFTDHALVSSLKERFK